MSNPRFQLANAIRALSMDAVQQANSGHPGMPMGMADIAEVLWNDFLRHNPANPHWFNRDRFVLSNGHGSMLHYSLLHLSGYDLPLAELKNFRQLGSKTPGHPEYGHTPGIETTTGPLGQGIANAVGMALAEKVLASHFNREGHDIIDHYTYVFLGDGCLMEGVSHEACSLAGTLGLGKLIAFWDNNSISIDGDVDGWFTDDTPKRFAAYGWQVIDDIDGHDPQEIKNAIEQAQAHPDKPTLICCETTIAFGSPNKAGTAASHGAPLGEEEVKLAKAKLGWEYGPFTIPSDIKAQWDARERGATLEADWQNHFAAYQKQHPELAKELKRRVNKDLPAHWQKTVQTWIEAVDKAGESIASRKASQKALEHVGPLLPELIGGSADLTGSNLTKWSGSHALSHDDMSGNYVYYGVREFGMSAIANGLALHGGLIPYTGTFLVFSDYARNALRMAALMKIQQIFVYTHDSIGLGEDGPTHQPVEHLASLRLIPNMSVWRPCDAVESAVAWQAALERQNGPTALSFSRQTLPHCRRDKTALHNIRCGGYVLHDAKDKAEVILIATGSEVALALESAKKLATHKIAARVVSMPSVDVFEAQSKTYRQSVLPPGVPVVAIEAGIRDYWCQFTGNKEAVVGMDSFGESAPADELFKHFGFTVEQVCKKVDNVLKQK